MADGTRAANERDTNRLETFSDGVIAIAITLLVIEIHAPGVAEAEGNRALWDKLWHLWPDYLGYVLSFLVIGIMWANHHEIFRHIGRVDHYLILLNTLLMLCIGFIPFTTALLAEHLNHPGDQTAMLVYSGWFTFTSVVYNVLWRYASSKGRLIAADADAATVKLISDRFRYGPLLYFVAFLVAFVSVEASLVVIGALALMYIVPYASRGRRAASGSAA